MTLSIVVNGTDLAGKVRVPDSNHRSFSFTESAEKGTVGNGGFQIDDPSSATTVPALKACVATESACIGATRLFSGYIADRSAARGPGLLTQNDRQWDINVVDSNTRLSDTVIQSGKRPAETTAARLAWLEGLMGYADHGLIEAGTTSLQAEDFTGRYAIDVLDGMSNITGNNFWLYVDQASGDLSLAYLDPLGTTGTNTSVKLTTDAAHLGVSGYFNVRRSAKYRVDPGRVYCGIYLEWSKGTTYRHNSTTHTQYRHRDVVVSAPQITTLAAANTQADAYLARVKDEEQRWLSVEAEAVPASQVNTILPGQRIWCIVATNGGTAKYMRVMRRTVSSRIDGLYDLELELAIPILTGFFPGSGIGGSTPPPTDPLTGWESAPTTTNAPIYPTVNRSSTGSWRNQNVSWPYTLCGVGLGGWQGVGYEKWVAMWDGVAAGTRVVGATLTFQYAQIAPVGGSPGYGHYANCYYLGDRAKAVWGPYRLYGGVFSSGSLPDPSTLTEGIALASFEGELSATLTIPIPSACISTAPMKFVLWLEPLFKTAGTFVCDGQADDSGGININSASLTITTLPVGAAGWIDASAIGTQDGSNTSFALLGGYSQVRSCTVNGFAVPSSGWSATDGSNVYTVGWAPASNDLVIWSYWTTGA